MSTTKPSNIDAKKEAKAKLIPKRLVRKTYVMLTTRRLGGCWRSKGTKIQLTDAQASNPLLQQWIQEEGAALANQEKATK